MSRIDFTNDTRTLGQIALDHPEIDHFHLVTLWTDDEGNAREHVSHAGIDRDPQGGSKWREERGLHGGYDASECARNDQGAEVLIGEQGRIDALTHCRTADWSRVVADEWHER